MYHKCSTGVRVKVSPEEPLLHSEALAYHAEHASENICVFWRASYIPYSTRERLVEGTRTAIIAPMKAKRERKLDTILMHSHPGLLLIRHQKSRMARNRFVK